MRPLSGSTNILKGWQGVMIDKQPVAEFQREVRKVPVSELVR
jgi:hypothetical protein